MAVGIIGTAVAALVGGGVSLLAFAPGVGDILTAQANNLFKGRVVTVIDAIRAYRRKDIDDSQFYRILGDNGFTKENADILYQSQFDRLTPQEIVTLFYRYQDKPENEYNVNVSWLQERLSQAGFDPDNYKEFLEANRPVPSLMDIIRFAVRDVFEPEQVEQAGLMQNLPQLYMHEAAKRGLNEQDAKYYWAAHWELPGLRQVYEMLHRLFDHPDPNIRFTDPDMDIFFNLADIAPGYRQRLKEISYHPLTRVDVRRIYRLGVWGTGDEAKQKVYRAYRELGYNEHNAKVMTDFTEAFEGGADRENTKTDVLRYYREGLWKENARENAKKMLVELGYNDDTVKRILDFEDLKKIDNDEQVAIEAVHKKYINGKLASKSEVVTELNKIGLTFTDIHKFADKWEKEKEAEEKTLSRSEADRLFRAGIIDEKQYRKYLLANGYVIEDIELLVQLFTYSETSTERLPNYVDVLNWYGENIIDEFTFIKRMKEIGYRITDIYYYALSTGREISIERIKEVDVNAEEPILEE